jgi:ATP-binding cassette, sub-family E, member 1
MNTFLQLLNITFRRDPTNFRPRSAPVHPSLRLPHPLSPSPSLSLSVRRINKIDSVKDREQKLDGNYFFMEE